MGPSNKARTLTVGLVGWIVCLLGSGCSTTGPSRIEAHAPSAPRELSKVSMPPYVIEPPDILMIDALRVVPQAPYKIQPLDALFVQATDALPTEPISGVFAVDPDGTINLGHSYGGIKVVDMTIEEAKTAIDQRLRKVVRNPQVNVSLAQSRASQQIRGDHIVRPDGTVSLGLYGSVYVTGKTLAEAKASIEEHLSQYLFRPEVSVDVFAYNSKVYYIITDGAGYGEQVLRVPATGNETVLDALSQINGLPAVASKERIWIARPAPVGQCPDQILPVDWCGITRFGRTTTNYQVMPGDRIYVMAEPLITTDTIIARVIAPFERIFGFALLVQSVKNSNSNRGNNAIR